jgi:redox-sensitive bicupin YhaK (pirin superfamily)
MTLDIRPFASFGTFQNDWLDTHYHFGFAHYHDPARMGVGPLRVWNDDTIRAGSGFDPHPHRDMEIITYVRRGAISHRDSEGNSGRTEAGDVQVMSAGTGIVHAEYNLDEEDTDLFQIWIEPRHTGNAPRWATRRFPRGDRAGRLIALASGRDDGDDALPIGQDAVLLGATIDAGATLTHELGPGRQAYVVPLGSAMDLSGDRIDARAGVVVRDVAAFDLTALGDGEVLVADLPV